jgi:hypothetical protein
MINWTETKDAMPQRTVCFVAGKERKGPYLFTAMALFKNGEFLGIDSKPLDGEVTHWVYADHPLA